MIIDLARADRRRSADRPGLRSRMMLASAMATITIALAPAALAQTAAAAGPASATQVGELVVTAEKRSETVQKVPMSVTAYSGAEIRALGISNLADLAYETPGVSERNSGPGQTEYEMRGIASSGGISPTVGFYLDDTPVTAPEESLLGKVVVDPSLFDLNRVEVLRGPQGTLYGSSSMGGTIKLVTNQPDPSGFAASAQAIGSGTQGGGFNYGGSVMVNIPLGQTAALRIVGTESRDDGWINRIVLSAFPQETATGGRGDVLSAPVAEDFKDSNWTRIEGVRAALLWQPVESLTITPMVFVQRVNQGAPNFVDNPPGVQNEAHYQPFDVKEPYADTFELYSLPIKYDFSHVELNIDTAYWSRQTSLTQDASEFVQDFLTAIIPIPSIFDLPNLPFADVGPVQALENDYTHQFSEEVRLNSTGSGPFQWLIGGFYEDYTSTTFIGTTALGAGTAPFLDPVLGANSLFNLTFVNRLQQYAGFGEASYRLGGFKLTAGLRYYDFQEHENLVEGGGLISGAGAPIAFVLPASSSGVDPKVNLSYEPNDDLTLYVQAEKGFRPGGGNPPPPVTCPSNPLQFAPDSLWSYEAGEKARLFGDRLVVNAAAYYEDWSGIQQLVSETCGATFTANVGSAHIYGGEVEASLNLPHGLTITTGGGYAHADLVGGGRVQDVPDWTDTTSIIYRRPINERFDLILRATNEYVGTMVDPSFAPINHIPVRDIVNLRAGLVNDRGVSVFLFANNINNKRADLGDPEEISFFVPALNRVMTNQPRTIGLELDYAFTGK